MSSLKAEFIPLHTKSYGVSSALVDVAVLCFVVAGLFIPITLVRVVLFVVLGVLIYRQESRLGLLVPASPGVLFWIGNLSSYVIGGLSSLIVSVSFESFGLRYLNSAILYLSLGLAAYTFGTYIARALVGSVTLHSNPITGLRLYKQPLLFFSAFFVIPVAAYSVTSGWSVTGLYYNLIIGALQSIEFVPMILLGIYLTRPKPDKNTLLILLAASLAVPFQGIVIGYGRGKLLFFVISALVVFIGLRLYFIGNLHTRVKVSLIVFPVTMLVYFGVSSDYRDQVAFDRTLSAEERTIILRSSLSSLTSVQDHLAESFNRLTGRLIELPSLELLGWVENGMIEKTSWTFEDTKQVLFSWIPKSFYPEKGVGYGRDIMEFYGLSPSWNNIPVTILTDSYRRFGVVGVLTMYFCMGLASTVVCIKLIPRWRGLGIVLCLYFSLHHLQIYTEDVLEVAKLYVYRLPTSSLVIMVLLWSTRIWSPSAQMNSQKRSQVIV